MSAVFDSLLPGTTFTISSYISIDAQAKESPFSPLDEHNTLLVEHINPNDYINPIPDEPYDLVVIGAGVSGLISVIIGAWLGKKCALIERHGMGGDCLNVGCVPSKALIACARAAHSVKNLEEFGVKIPSGEVSVDFAFVMRRMRAIRAKISHHDSVQRYSREFCKHVFVGQGTFVGNKVRHFPSPGNQTTYLPTYLPTYLHANIFPNNACVILSAQTVKVLGADGSERFLAYRKAMVATGASAAIPPVPGLRDVPHLTNRSDT